MTDEAGDEVSEPNLQRMLRVAGVLFGGFALAMVALFGVIFVDARDDRRDNAERDAELAAAVAAIEEQRATARISSCAGLAEFQSAHNDLVRQSAASDTVTLNLLRALRVEATSTETLGFLDGQIATYEAAIAAYDGNIVPVRDCSPAGIEAFANGTGGYLP